jgi:hypothetical protein
MQKLLPLAALLATVAFACGGAAVPRERAESADSAWKGARAAGAEGYPQANEHLKNAEKGIQEAKDLIKNGDNEKADFVLQVAKAEADLASSLTQENAAKQEASRKQDQVKALEQNPGAQQQQ